MRHLYRKTVYGPHYYYPLILLLCFLAAVPARLAAQQGTPLSFLKRTITLTGQAGTYGELYTASGISGRRPPSTLRFSLTPRLTVSRYVSLSANILLSTEGSRARQNINILGLHPVWRWGRAHLGDYSDNFSRYSFNGVNVKGAEVDLYPGKFRFTAGGGRTKRAVEGMLVHESYGQTLFSSRLGYGEKNGSRLDVIFVRVKDDPASLQKPDDWDYDYINPDTLETELDTIWVEPPYNPRSVTPQENMVIGFASRIRLFNNRLIWEIEGNGSAFTRDIQAAPVSVDSIETGSLLRTMYGRIFTPRAGSQFDFAFNTLIGLTLSKFKINAGFRHIGPGYYSLGIPSTVNDRQELLLNTHVKAGANRIRISWNRLSDNLLGQKMETNIRNQLQASVSTIFSSWRSQITVRWLGLNNHASSDSLAWDFSNFIFTTNQSLVLDNGSPIRQLGLQYTYQTSQKNMPGQSGTTGYHTLNLTSDSRFGPALRMSLTAGLSRRSSTGSGTYTTQVYSLRFSHAALNNRLITSLFSSSSMVRETRMFRTGLTSNCRLSRNYRLTATASYNNFQGTRNYRELRTSIMLTRQF